MTSNLNVLRTDKFPIPSHSAERNTFSLGVDTFVERIGPKEAAIYLNANIANRPISERNISLLASSMKNGEWRLNGEPLIFFKDGTLGDGQHRLGAVLRSGTTQDFLVVRGIEKSTFSTIDIGKPRGASDALALVGELNYAALSSAVRAFLQYGLNGRAVYLITPTQIIDCLSKNPDIRVWSNKRCNKRALKAFPASLAAFSTIASRIHGVDVMDTFFEQLASGVGLQKGGPALLLRERIFSTHITRMTKRAADAFIIKAINAHTKGRSLAFLRWTESEDFPLIT